mgnify:CR=1 FL=1
MRDAWVTASGTGKLYKSRWPRAGLKLNYGCGNGSCGMCKVRVIDGEVARIEHVDYPLSEAEKAQGYTLLCAHTAASSELTLETLEASGPQDIAPQQIVTTLRQVRELAPDTRALQLQTPRSHRLRFLAGQSVTLALSGREEGDDLHRTLPVASCPCDDRNLHFIVGRDHAGVGSYYGPFDAHHIFDELPKGALETQALKIDWTFWCYKCGGMASARTCPHGEADRLLLSGTKLRKMLSEDGEVPAEFSRPEVLEVLRRYYAGLEAHEKVEVKLSGHSAR